MEYGPHERNVLDLWQARAAGPRPLLVYIHGGGWNAGDKSAVKVAPYRADLLSVMLQKGVSVASVNYRYSRMAPLPAPVRDAARAIQFLRSRAQEWNLSKDRVAATGLPPVVAPACGSLTTPIWRIRPAPIRSSASRRGCARPTANPRILDRSEGHRRLGGDQVMNHQMTWRSVGATSREDALTHYDRFQSLYRAFSPINFVSRGGAPPC